MLESKEAAQLFTSNAIQKIANGDYSLLNKIVIDYLDVKFSNIKISEIFDLTLLKISKEYKNEYFYKNTIANKLFFKKHFRKNATMLFEFRVGKNKADCAIFNGHSICYEIKTEFDNLKRLPEQISEFSKIFDRVNVICASVHLPKVTEIIPTHVGIIELTEKGILKDVRKAEDIDIPIDPNLLIQSLRREEYVYIAKKICRDEILINNMEIYKYCSEIMKECSTVQLRNYFRDAIKIHRKIDYATLENIPDSLISSIISYKISVSVQNKLNAIMSDYINKDELCIFH